MRMVTEARELLKKFYKLQEERVETYRLFEEGFQAYLAAAPHYDFNRYRQLVHEITEAFKAISQDIIDIESKLRNTHGFPNVSDFICKIQDDEKKKLEVTAKLQLEVKNVVDHPDEESYKEEVAKMKAELRDIIERINEHLEELKYEAEDIYQS